MSILIRDQHDKENPYTMISRNLIRDKNLSMEARLLLIHLLSNDGRKWEIRVNCLIKEFQGHCGKQKMYDLINECIQAGYIFRKQENKGKFSSFHYIVSEYPKFKKCLPLPGFPDAGFPDPAKQDAKERAIPSVCNQEQFEDISPLNPPQKNKPPAQFSAAASELREFFIQNIKRNDAEFEVRNVAKWDKDFDALLRLDMRDKDEVKKIIDFLCKDKKALSYCMCPDKIRKKWGELRMRYLGQKEQIMKDSNMILVRNWQQNNPQEFKFLKFTKDYVMNVNSGKELSLNLPSETFKREFSRMFGGKND